ncbi:hypothetical protein PCL_09153 [Purpureocillium lilacinum]|uniref:Uncharacterized protein n=1 Tax=Purpureocillium lilacinum TaxID=33203 RepID=A0A2U3EH84_PURLI|nr:hypothetical protein PCL_09153 [Purpureocillium lilacinum]
MLRAKTRHHARYHDRRGVPVLHPPTPRLASLQSCMSGEARGGAIPVVAALGPQLWRRASGDLVQYGVTESYSAVQCSAALHSDVKQNKRQVCLAFSLVRGNKLPALANPKRRSQKKWPSARCSGDRRLERALGFHYQILPGSALPCRAKSQRCGARPARFAPGGGSHGGVPPWSPPPRKGPGPPQSEPWERLGCPCCRVLSGSGIRTGGVLFLFTIVTAAETTATDSSALESPPAFSSRTPLLVRAETALTELPEPLATTPHRGPSTPLLQAADAPTTNT